MPPCLGSSATAVVVSEPAAISSEAATTHRCAKRIAIPPYSLGALRFCAPRGPFLKPQPRPSALGFALRGQSVCSVRPTSPQIPANGKELYRGLSTLHGEAVRRCQPFPLRLISHRLQICCASGAQCR